MNSALILCGGDQTRWKSASPKQLVDIHGEPLIERTLRQLRALNVTPLISTSENDFKFYRDRCAVLHSKQTKCHSLLANLTPGQDTHIAVLCGDVVWSDGAINRIVNDHEKVNVFGSFFQSEIWGFSFQAAAWNRVSQCLTQASHAGGRLWNFYRALIGVPLDKHMLDAKLWCDITDGFTTDFDFQEQYERWVEKHPTPL